MENTSVLHVENEDHLKAFLRGLMDQSRVRLDGVLDRLNASPKTKSLLTEWGKQERAYPLMCGFSQELLTYNLEDSGYTANPFTSDSIQESSFSHCAVSLPVKIGKEETKLHVILDLTYTQFALPAELYPAFGLKEIQARKSPLSFLMKTEEGRALWNDIKKDGFFVMTEEKAGLYAESLCPNSGLSPSAALRLLINPPFHPTNLKHGRGRLSKENCLGMDVKRILKETSPEGEKSTENPSFEKQPVLAL